MSHRPFDAVSLEEARRSAAIVRAHLLDVEADRPKRIDQYLDYFGEGRRSAGLPPRGGPSPPAAVGETLPATPEG
jgi:hypothetical protein